MNALIILFYRIVTLFTSVPAKTRAKHTYIRAEKLKENSIISSSYINRQEDFSDIPYGAGNLGLNGCGPIALYNAIRALSEQDFIYKDNVSFDSFSSIIDYLELKGAAFRGRLGTAPHIINRYLRIKGYNTKVFFGTKANELNTFSNEFDAFISLVYNDKNSIKKGLHFICATKSVYGSFTTHNPERTADSLYKALDMCSKDEIRHIYTIGIKNSEQE